MLPEPARSRHRIGDRARLRSPSAPEKCSLHHNSSGHCPWPTARCAYGLQTVLLTGRYDPHTVLGSRSVTMGSHLLPRARKQHARLTLAENDPLFSTLMHESPFAGAIGLELSCLPFRIYQKK